MGKRKAPPPAQEDDSALHRWISATPVQDETLTLLQCGDLQLGNLLLVGAGGTPRGTRAAGGEDIVVSTSVRLWDDERQWCEVTEEVDDGESVEVSVLEAGVLPLAEPLFTALAALQRLGVVHFPVIADASRPPRSVLCPAPHSHGGPARGAQTLGARRARPAALRVCAAGLTPRARAARRWSP